MLAPEQPAAAGDALLKTQRSDAPSGHSAGPRPPRSHNGVSGHRAMAGPTRAPCGGTFSGSGTNRSLWPSNLRAQRAASRVERQAAHKAALILLAPRSDLPASSCAFVGAAVTAAACASRPHTSQAAGQPWAPSELCEPHRLPKPPPPCPASPGRPCAPQLCRKSAHARDSGFLIFQARAWSPAATSPGHIGAGQGCGGPGQRRGGAAAALAPTRKDAPDHSLTLGVHTPRVPPRQGGPGHPGRFSRFSFHSEALPRLGL